MIFFFPRFRRERGGICSREKWGTEQRRQTWKCHKNLRVQLVQAVKAIAWPLVRGGMAHRGHVCLCSTAHPELTPAWASCLSCPGSQSPSAPAPSSPHHTHTHSSWVWQRGRALCTAILPAHSALESISMASRGTICTSAVFPSETSLNYLKA